MLHFLKILHFQICEWTTPVSNMSLGYWDWVNQFKWKWDAPRWTTNTADRCAKAGQAKFTHFNASLSGLQKTKQKEHLLPRWAPPSARTETGTMIIYESVSVCHSLFTDSRRALSWGWRLEAMRSYCGWLVTLFLRQWIKK